MVDVNLSDMGAMMGPWGRGMMGMMVPRMMPGMGMMRNLRQALSRVPAGQVSFQAINTGGLSHELVVLPLPQGFPGQRVSGPDGKVDETGSLGEASRTCGADQGDEQSAQYGILPGATGWTTVTLSPGRYELICNIAGHYVGGMYAELDVTGAARIAATSAPTKGNSDMAKLSRRQVLAMLGTAGACLASGTRCAALPVTLG